MWNSDIARSMSVHCPFSKRERPCHGKYTDGAPFAVNRATSSQYPPSQLRCTTHLNGARAPDAAQSSAIFTGAIFQIRSQYSATARSDENFPERAVLRIDMRAQRAGSCHAALTRAWHAT